MHDNTDGRLRGRKLQAARRRIWDMHPRCAKCNTLVSYPDGFELDHVQAVHKGLDNSDENLQILCVRVDEHGNKTGCHVDKTNREQGHKERAEFDTSGRVVW